LPVIAPPVTAIKGSVALHGGKLFTSQRRSGGSEALAIDPRGGLSSADLLASFDHRETDIQKILERVRTAE
jgi:hypothetical protein